MIVSRGERLSRSQPVSAATAGDGRLTPGRRPLYREDGPLVAAPADSHESQLPRTSPSAFPDSPSRTFTSRRGSRDLYERFCDECEAAEPELWRAGTRYQQAPDALQPHGGRTCSSAMAPHVSRFIARLFQVGPRRSGWRGHATPTTTSSASRSTSSAAAPCRC